MTRHFHHLAMMIALCAILLAAAPAAAAGKGAAFGGNGQAVAGSTKMAIVGDAQVAATATVTQTFRLTLYGSAPRGDAMIVRYRTTAPNGTVSAPQIHVFCGDFRSAIRDYAAKAACKGGGTVYFRSLSVAKGSSISFSFERQRATDAKDRSTSFYRDAHRLDYNWLDYAWYRYGA